MPYNGDNEVIALLFEKFFIACVTGDEAVVDGLKDDFLYAEGTSPSALRAHAAYRRVTGENEWADSLEKSFFTSLDDSELPGYAASEREIYRRYLGKNSRAVG